MNWTIHIFVVADDSRLVRVCFASNWVISLINRRRKADSADIPNAILYCTDFVTENYWSQPAHGVS